MAALSKLIVKKAKSRVSSKHVPLRTCIACRKTGPKQALVRLVLTPEGAVTVDAGRKLAGRGVYLCRETLCWEKGVSEKTLSHAFRTGISRECLAGLRGHMGELFGDSLREGGK
ncbi:MAG: YlxR family protein [Chloroflexi bacterium]|nr:YlxR family protein [Chloroflexota bacterium]